MKFSRKLISIMLSVMLIASYAPMAYAAETSDSNLLAYSTKTTILVNGVVLDFEAYNINDNNYFKLRDIAQAISGTKKQFEVGWNAASGAVSLTSGKPYTTIGGEMNGGDGKDKTATKGSSNIVKDGEAISLTAYLINGNNYFKLRDLGQSFDFEVAWDANNDIIIIDTSKPYSGKNASASEYISYYEAYSDVPDLGTLLNLLCQNDFIQDQGTDSEQHVYLYSSKNVNNPWNAIATYLDALMDSGFYLDASSRGDNFFYCISKSGRIVQVSWNKNKQDTSLCDGIMLNVYTQLLSADELAKLNFPD